MPYYPMPTDAESFIAFMERVWEGDDWDLYKEYQDAMRTIRLCKTARRTGSAAPSSDKRCGQVWRFPDGSGVAISADGAGVRWAMRKAHSKK